MAGAEVDPLAGIGLTQNHRTRSTQPRHEISILRCWLSESKRTDTGEHLVTGINIVFD
jgi:hypothetical protein